MGRLAGQLLSAFTSYSGDVLVMIALCSLLSLFSSQSCNPGKVWWRNPGLVVDVCYWLSQQFVAPYFRKGLLIAIATFAMAFVSADDINDYINNGSGPIAVHSFYGQVALYLLLSDFAMYWIHRVFHGSSFWRYHAIHHSAKDVDWSTAYRFHPLNLCFGSYMIDIVMLYLGIAPAVLLFMAPFQTMSALFVHDNLNWTLGLTRYVVATPVFHRWHHTTPDEGGNSQLRADLCPVGRAVRHLLHAARRAAGALRSRRSAFPVGFPRPAGVSVSLAFAPRRAGVRDCCASGGARARPAPCGLPCRSHRP